MDNFTPCTIGLGSNTPDREEQIAQATDFLRTILHDSAVSAVYESEAYNGKDKPYLNCVIHGKSTIGKDVLIARIKNYEQSRGRTAEKTSEGEVCIDIDLVIWGSRILRPKDFERHYFNIGYRSLLAEGAFLDD